MAISLNSIPRLFSNKTEWVVQLNQAVKKPSIIFLFFSCCFIFWFNDLLKSYSPKKNQTNFAWDGLGYYSYLPSTFFYNGTFEFDSDKTQFLATNEAGKRYSKYPYGVALLEFPFYSLAYLISYTNHSSLNGFSSTFADYLRLGNIIYVFIGLLLLRKLLLHFFNETVTALTLFCCLFASMLYIYTFAQSEIAHGYLFALFSIFLYYTFKWHQNQKISYAVVLAVTLGLVSITRFTEIYISLLFIFWDVKKPDDIKTKAKLFIKNYKQLLLFIVAIILFWIPQCLYWKQYLGSYFINPYVGEKFYWLDPQILNVLFSYRKGWLLYTPIALLGIIGLFFVKKSLPVSKYFLIVLVVLLVYVFSCWWDWGYGGCFGNRAFCQLIAVLSIPIASLINFVLFEMTHKKIQNFLSGVLITFIFSCSFLNIGQSFQYYVHGMLHSYNMSKGIYWGIFRNYHYSRPFVELYPSLEHQRNYSEWKNGLEREDK